MEKSLERALAVVAVGESVVVLPVRAADEGAEEPEGVIMTHGHGVAVGEIDLRFHRE